MNIAIAQISPKLSRDNFILHEEIITKVKSQADIVIFPELSLNGYMLMDSVYEDAFLLREMQHFEALSEGIDIVLGAATKEEHRIYNSALYFSEGKLLSLHHKNHLPNYGMFQEARFFFKGEGLKFFETKFGKTAMVVCEDLWSADIVNQIASKKPDLVYVIASSPARGFGEDGLEIEKKWNDILSATAVFSGAYVVFSNRVGFEDGLGFWGGSKVVNPAGKIESSAKLFEKDILISAMDHNLSSMQKYLLRID